LSKLIVAKLGSDFFVAKLDQTVVYSPLKVL